MITGHEFWGEIAKVGKNAKGLKVGDRVAVDICLTCGTCYFCRRERRTALRDVHAARHPYGRRLCGIRESALEKLLPAAR